MRNGNTQRGEGKETATETDRDGDKETESYL